MCVRPSIRLSICLSIVFLDYCGSSEHQTWTCYQVGGIDGKIRLWGGEAGETDGCRGECALIRDRVMIVQTFKGEGFSLQDWLLVNELLSTEDK